MRTVFKGVFFIASKLDSWMEICTEIKIVTLSKKHLCFVQKACLKVLHLF